MCITKWASTSNLANPKGVWTNVHPSENSELSRRRRKQRLKLHKMSSQNESFFFATLSR